MCEVPRRAELESLAATTAHPCLRHRAIEMLRARASPADVDAVLGGCCSPGESSPLSEKRRECVLYRVDPRWREDSRLVHKFLIEKGDNYLLQLAGNIDNLCHQIVLCRRDESPHYHSHGQEEKVAILEREWRAFEGLLRIRHGVSCIPPSQKSDE